jgi:hypothetical protein
LRDTSVALRTNAIFESRGFREAHHFVRAPVGGLFRHGPPPTAPHGRLGNRTRGTLSLRRFPAPLNQPRDGRGRDERLGADVEEF